MSESDERLPQPIEYSLLEDRYSEGYKRIFKDGKAIVPIRKVSTPQFGRLDERGEPKDVNPGELWNYYRADGTVQQTFGLTADLVIAYGYSFDMPLPITKKLEDNQNEFIHLLELWRGYVAFDEKIKDSILQGRIFGDFFAEKVYDDGGALSKTSWGIKSIKVLDPRTVYVDRSNDGKVRNYYQHPKAHQIQPRNLMKSTRSIKIPAAQMIHIKFDDIINKTYGMSRMYALLDTIDMKIGLKSDAVQIAQRRASPFLVWSIGSEDKIFPPDLIAEIRGDLEGQLLDVTEHDVFVPGFIKVEVVGGDNTAGVDLLPIIDFMNKEVALGSGVPDIIIAGSSASGEAAKAKEEIFTRQIKALQQFIFTEWRNQCLVDLVFPPKKDGKGGVKAEEINPAKYEKIPLIKANIIESVADGRLRMEAMSNSAFMGEEEGRKQLGLRGKLDDEEHVLPNRIKLKEVDVKEKQADKPPVPMGGNANPTNKPRQAKATSVSSN